MTDPFAVSDPATQKLYAQLLKAVKPVGKFEIELKMTCVHLVRDSAFLGVHPRKAALRITVKSAQPIDSDRVLKLEQASKNRWHADLKIESAQEIDSELLDLVRQSYQLCG